MTHHVSRSRLIVLTVTILALLAVGIIPALGASNNDFTAYVDCAGFTPSGSITANRDNTGAGQESIAISVVDGNGTVVLQVVDAVPLNWTVTPPSTVMPWTQTPAANPINVSVVSLAGNGLAEQAIYSVSGGCAGLPQGGVTDASGAVVSAPSAILAPVSTAVSAPVLLNQQMPTPITNTAAIEALSVYAIVDTPNLNLRTGDGPQYLPVAVLSGGTRTRVVGRNQTASWWLLEASGYVGWASAEFVAVRGDATDLPVVPSAGTLIPPSMVLAISKPVYSAPNNFTNNYVCEIVPGEYYLNGRNREGTHYQAFVLCQDGRTLNAWIAAEEILFRNPAGNLLGVVE